MQMKPFYNEDLIIMLLIFITYKNNLF